MEAERFQVSEPEGGSAVPALGSGGKAFYGVKTWPAFLKASFGNDFEKKNESRYIVPF